MVGIMAESSIYVVREFHEKCFNRSQFILRTVKAPNTFLRSFSETSPTHDVFKDMLTSHFFTFFKINPFLYVESYFIIYKVMKYRKIHITFFWITSDFSIDLLQCTSELQTPITFLFVNENIKCGYAFS